MLSRLKWLVSGVVLAAIAISGGSIALVASRQHAMEQQRLVRQREMLVQQAEKLELERKQLAEVIERLNVERRVALVDVVQQHTDENGMVVQTVIRLTEIGRDGEPLPGQVFGIPSAVPHFDALVIKFEKDYVAKGDPLRGHSLTLFRRVYGETQSPENGYWLGRMGEVPDIYRISAEPSEFEIKLWRDFWAYAADPEKARGAGVRVAQGEVVYAPMKPGEQWRLTLEADGGLNLIKQDEVSETSVGIRQATLEQPSETDR